MNKNKKLTLPEGSNIINKKGEKVQWFDPTKIVRVVQQICVFKKDNGEEWAFKDDTVWAPPSWTWVTARITHFELSYGHEYYEGHSLGHIGVTTNITRLSDEEINLRVNAILRDNDGNNKWEGIVYAEVIFYD